MKSLFFSPVLVAAALAALSAHAQNTPAAPVPHGAGATPGSIPPAPAAAAAADPTAPVDPATPEDLKQYGLDRYDRIVEKSPFNFKIVKQEGPPPISFAVDLSLAGYTRDLDKGIEYASLVDKKKNTRFVINSLSPHKESGIQLVKLNPGETLLLSTVIARKGGEEVEIKAEKQIVERKSVVAAAVAGGRQGQPQQGGLPPGAQGGAPGGPRQNNVQAQINTQLQPPTPGPNPQQPNPQQPNAAPGGGQNVSAGSVQTTALQPATPPAQTVADRAVQQQNPAAAAQSTGAAPGTQPNKRRVILPPPVPTQ